MTASDPEGQDVGRHAELSANLDALRERVARACRDANRSPEEIVLIAITKTFPAADVRLLAELGVHDVGENRDQEASDKAAECADLRLDWHFVGQLQTNKARSVATYASVVHSLDRLRIITALNAATSASERSLDCFIQVSLDPLESERGPSGQPRGGAAPAEVPRLADAIGEAESLRLLGVMAVAPNGADPRPAFDRLGRMSAALVIDHPEARAISAGMSGDFEIALAAGATHLRVGAALLGRRARTG